MGYPPVGEDNPPALASGLSYVQANNPWYNYLIPPTSVQTLHSTYYFVLKLVRVVQSNFFLSLKSFVRDIATN